MKQRLDPPVFATSIIGLVCDKLLLHEWIDKVSQWEQRFYHLDLSVLMGTR